MTVRLLAIDPSLTATGFLTAIVPRYGQVEFREAGTVTTKDSEPLAVRLALLHEATEAWLEMAAANDGTPSLYVVIEDPFFVSGRMRRAPRTTHVLGAAFGVIAGTVCGTFPPELRAAHVQTVPVGGYYPRIRGQGARHMGKDLVERRGRSLLPPNLSKSSEHVCMAAVLAHWWSRGVTAARLFSTRCA